MKALTCWQPWADLIAFGEKHVETRSWSTSYRGPLAIHAAKLRTKEAQAFIEEPDFFTRCPKLGGPKHTFVYGAIVALGTLVDCRLMSSLEPGRISAHEASLGWYAPDRYAWILADVRPLLAPLPITGHQALWGLTQEDQARVRLEVAGIGTR